MNENIITIFTDLYLIHYALSNIREAQAYKKIIKLISEYPKKITDVNQLKGIEGIGKNTLLKIDEILKTGHLKLLDNFKKDKNIMARVELSSILGIGPKIAKSFVDQKIYNRKQLLNLYQKGKIDLNQRQIIGLLYYDKLHEPIPRNEITKFCLLLNKVLKKKFPKIEIHMAGSYRRKKQYSNDIDIILTVPEIKTKDDLDKKFYIFDEIIKYLYDKKILIIILAKGIDNLMAINNKYRQIDIRLSPYYLLPFYLLYFGSGEIFSRKIRQIAKNKGYTLSELGIKGFLEKAKSEKEIFDFLDIPYVSPENR